MKIDLNQLSAHKKVLLFAAAIAILASIVLYGYHAKKSKSEPTPTPTLTVNQVREKLVAQGKKTGLDTEIYKTDEYSITYVSVDNLFRVRILKPPYRENKLAAEQWFKNQGATNKQLCYLDIRFNPEDEDLIITQKEDTIPAGCTN